MPRQIPLLLLKTKTIPRDSYEELFSAPDSRFTPAFIPVLEHRPNEENLQRIKRLIRERELNERYGGMIFTSQRAVEGFARIVSELEREREEDDDDDRLEKEKEGENQSSDSTNSPSIPAAYALTGAFPLYVVGPATSRTLSNLVNQSPTLSALKCEIQGAETGTGEKLVGYILKHYNAAHARDYFERYEAPRLPFVPLVGNRSEQYPRLEAGDERLRKRPLLFLVGETRRDFIPKTLMDASLGERRIDVEEVEVYSTGVMTSFEDAFRQEVSQCVMDQGGGGGGDHTVIVTVVFSPSGCEAMLRVLGRFQRQQPGAAAAADKGPPPPPPPQQQQHVLVTIGPTTRDHLRHKFGVDPDVCAKTPSPEGIAEGVQTWLDEHERG